MRERELAPLYLRNLLPAFFTIRTIATFGAVSLTTVLSVTDDAVGHQ